MVIIHHNKDMDGYASGAICKLRYPDATLIGWDYKDPIPNLGDFADEDVIMIDITFPLEKLLALSHITNSLVVIDHHISFKKGYDSFLTDNNKFKNFTYIYEDRVAACEIGWKYLFPDKEVPYGVTLIGRYDTWRQEEGYWEGETLPFKYYMYSQCNTSETFPKWVLKKDDVIYDKLLEDAVYAGKSIMKYQRTMDEATTKAYSFVREAYGGLRAICLNQPYFSSETVASAYTDEKHDIMIGFAWGGDNWRVSLRSVGDKVDVSLIAKSKGGGGHKNAGGFEVEHFEDIFK